MKILMLTESNYPLDVRVRQEAELLQKNRHTVTVVALKEQNQNYCECIRGVRIYRIPKIELFRSSKQKKERNYTRFGRISLFLKALLGYGVEYLYFTSSCMILSFFILIKERIDVVHTHNPPDTLFIVALAHKLFGAKFVYDHHDLSPDLFLEKYKSGGFIIYRLLLLLERLSCRFADIIIATNESYKMIETTRCGVRPDKIYVVRNGPDLNKVRKAKPIEGMRKGDEIIVCYLGAINNQDGLDNLIEAFSLVVHEYKNENCKLMIVGDGDYLFQIKQLAYKHKIQNYTVFTGYIADRDILNRYLSTADIFADSAPYSFLNDNSTFIKHMEYMVFNKPIISFALRESICSVGDAGVFVEPNSTSSYAKALIDLINSPRKREEIGNRGNKRIPALSWERVSQNLLKAYNAL